MLQNSASNPSNSVFVSASAGSGKTKVLTDRTLRLLLLGVSPSKILCLTFTKVAAIEMQKRIFSELESWVMMDDEALKNHLEKLNSKPPSNFEIKAARKLFATLLDDNSGLQISTIHSFCQSIIKKFPVEAKTSPNFSIIDDQKENQLLLEARKNLLSMALQDPKLAAQINLISARLNENSFLEISSEIIRKRHNLSEIKERYFGIDGVIQAVYEELKINPDENEETVFTDFVNDENWKKNNLVNLCESTEIKNKEVIKKFISNPILDNLEEYLSVFLTTENEARKQLTTKAIQKENPLAEEIMRSEQERVLQFLEKFNTVKIAVSTATLLVVVDKIIEIYNFLKNQNGYLDYSDLIIKTSQLLENSANREWVKYKLDGIYEHILIDESQDTNHQQWNIVKAITEEFFVGSGAVENANRTIFIVGDEKQSIYSFQGAEPDIFANIFHYYQDKLKGIDQKFLNIELTSSYRSMPAILQTVDKVFASPELTKAISTLATKIEHISVKNKHFGKVELLPIVGSNIQKKDDKEKDQFLWNLDFTTNEEYKAQEILAQMIACKIKSFFIKGKFLNEKNRNAEFGDVMILLKERKSNLGNLLIKYLNDEQIPVASSDRINFADNIIVQDLISLARFTLLPQDDLNLACLLKSVLFNVSEEELFEICLVRNESKISLFESLKQKNPHLFQELTDLLSFNEKQQFSIEQFFSYVLIFKHKQKEIFTRFGEKGVEILNQFFKVCVDYQSNNIASSMENFVQFLEESELEIKIDSHHHQNQVYITTVHSSKGLEAPIVFLADSAHTAAKQFGNDRRRIFWDQKSGLPFWSSGKNFDNDILRRIKKSEKEIVKKEYWRQLYVAMTRAEEELYVCGFGEKFDKDCWYEVIKNAISDSALKIDKSSFGKEFEDYLIDDGLIIGSDNYQEKLDYKPLEEIKLNSINQDFIHKLPKNEGEEMFLYPSKLDDKNSDLDNNGAVEYGTLIHKILEILLKSRIDDIQKRGDFIKEYLTGKISDRKAIQDVISRINTVFKSDYLNNLNSRSEVPIIAKINGKIVSGKIDLLIVDENEVMVIDFKTGKKDEAKYQGQMEMYKQALGKIYPTKKIKSEIFWI